MTPERLKQIKARSIYARENCQHDENCSNAVKCLPACIDEIGRLRGLAKSAFREGGDKGRETTHRSTFDEDNYWWEHSESRKALEQE